MTWRERYERHKDAMRVGDVIACGGHGLLSRLIMTSSGSPVSHACMVSSEAEGDRGPLVLEATRSDGDLAGKQGVGEDPLAHFLQEYEGDVWWLPLAVGPQRIPPTFERAAFDRFVDQVIGTPFDDVDGALSVVRDVFDNMLQITDRSLFPDTDRFFCSELVVYALQVAGVVDPNIDSSITSPKDLCGFSIYGGPAVPLKGNAALDLVVDGGTLGRNMTDLAAAALTKEHFGEARRLTISSRDVKRRLEKRQSDIERLRQGVVESRGHR